jgi:IS5 family transposase
MEGDLLEAFLKAQRIYHQQPQDQHKLLSWHAPEVECISKGKAHKPYEFGCKVSVISTVNKAKGGHFVLQSTALHGNPYDGHTLKGAIDCVFQSIRTLNPVLSERRIRFNSNTDSDFIRTPIPA